MPRLVTHACTAAFIALLLAAGAPAEGQHVAGALHLGLRTGATAYGGEYDGTGGASTATRAWMYRDLGLGLGGEIGYRLTPSLSVGLDLHVGRYANLDRTDGFNPLTGTIGQRNEGEGVSQLQALLRFHAPVHARLAPYLQAGGALAVGQGNGVAYGPALGAGVEYAITPRMAVFVEATGSMLFPDGAVDGFDPDGQGLTSADAADYDALTQYGAGVRYTVRTRAGDGPPALDCPGALGVGEPGTFNARTPGATASARWVWGDGTAAAGAEATHAYANPGTYTARFSARVRGREVTSECSVTVQPQGPPPVLDACAASPVRVAEGAPVSFGAAVVGAAVIRWDFGDGGSAEAIETVHAYEAAGSYEATLTASGPGGTAACRVAVSVGTADEVFCEGVQSLAPAHFGFGMGGLSVNAQEQLSANVPLLKRCPALCVRLDGFTDGTERMPRLALTRAEAVRDYYLRAGIAPGRIEIRDRGQAPDAEPGRDPLPGDRTARRVESVPKACDVPQESGD